jgi:hypothetical protein
MSNCAYKTDRGSTYDVQDLLGRVRKPHHDNRFSHTEVALVIQYRPICDNDELHDAIQS